MGPPELIPVGGLADQAALPIPAGVWLATKEHEFRDRYDREKRFAERNGAERRMDPTTRRETGVQGCGLELATSILLATVWTGWASRLIRADYETEDLYDDAVKRIMRGPDVGTNLDTKWSRRHPPDGLGMVPPRHDYDRGDMAETVYIRGSGSMPFYTLWGWMLGTEVLSLWDEHHDLVEFKPTVEQAARGRTSHIVVPLRLLHPMSELPREGLPPFDWTEVFP